MIQSKNSPFATAYSERALHNIDAPEKDGNLVSDSLQDNPRVAYVATPERSNELHFNLVHYFSKGKCASIAHL